MSIVLTKTPKTITKSFYKENGIWYIDLPEFLEKGLGSKNNLMMVAGADTYLDKLSDNTHKVTVEFSPVEFKGYTDRLVLERYGLDKNYLTSIGHAPVENGAYYRSDADSHELWLCPVTLYVFFSTNYPTEIFIRKVEDSNL